MPLKRWPLVRHVRWLILQHQVYRMARYWGEMGIGLGVPSENDLAYLQEIWDGKA
jgi:hypothetical protein